MNRFELLHADGTLALDQGCVLALNAAPAPILRECAKLDCIQPLRPINDALRQSGHTVVQGPTGQYRTTLLRLPRSRDEARGMFAQAWDVTEPDGIIAVTGAKTDGIDALIKGLRTLGLAVETRPKAHGKVVWLHRSQAPVDGLNDWAAAAKPRKTASGFFTAPGLFSADGIDPGSALLTETLPTDLAGQAADLGTGWGYLSHYMLAQNPRLSALHLVEADQRALELAKANVHDQRAEYHWADATDPENLPKNLDLIVMNPPFHKGRTAEPDIGQAFIRTAAAMLGPKGKLFLVANTHLPYEAVLNKHFAKSERIKQDAGYKVIRSERPISDTARR